MSHLNPGLISAYNSLTDKHLAGYFSNTRIRRHLQRAGLITRSGRIVPDKEYRHKLMQRVHQRHVRECLAQAIFHKVLEMERLHQIEIKRKLEEFARRERVHRIKVERSKRYEEEIIRILSPRPPTGTRDIRKQHSGPEGEHSESSESPGSSRPNTAPGKMQRPVRLKPIQSSSTTASLRRSSPYRRFNSSKENGQLFNDTMNKESRRRLTTVEGSRGISPYCLPVINNFVTPVPPATKRKERGVKVPPSGTLRGRRLRPTTASSGADISEDPLILRSSVHQSRVCVNMVYFGKSVHLSHDLTDMKDEVKVFQQHCGGENLCVYRGKLQEGETFQFISRRHRGFPFSLTFYLNGLQVERLSSCCEFKHRKGSRLGGRHGHFGFTSIEGASPCYKCIIAMGLDKKPIPPPKRVKDDVGREESVASPKDPADMETEVAGEDAASHSGCETGQQQDTENQVKDETAAEDKVRNDYEEDFEADDEGPAGDPEAKEEKSPSPATETEKQVKESDTSDTEDYENDDIKSHSRSSSSSSSQEESDAEATKHREDETAEPEEVDQDEDKEVVPEADVASPDEQDEPNPEEAAATETESTFAKDLQDSAGDSTEINISDTSVPSGTENKQSDDTSVDNEAENMVDKSKQEEEQERAKSVQEKLAEAILKESQCSSEPELSDTSTEEEEESTDKGVVPENSVTFTEEQTLAEETKSEDSVIGEQDQEETPEEMPEPKEEQDETEKETVRTDEDNEKGATVEEAAEKDGAEDIDVDPASEKNMAEENKTSETQEDAPLDLGADTAQKADEMEAETAEAEEGDTQPEPKEKEDETEKETIRIDEDNEKGATEEEAAEKDASEDMDADPASAENMVEESKTSEAQEDTLHIAQKSEEMEDETAQAKEGDTQPDETEQGAKSSEEDESSVSELNKTTAEMDNAEAEAAMTESETMEMKAEPSEEQEALSCEEAPANDTEEMQQGDGENRTEAPEIEITADNLSSSSPESGDTMVEKTADLSEDNAMDEGNKDEIEDGEAEQVPAVEDGGEKVGEEQTEKFVEIDEIVGEKSEEEGTEEEKQKGPDEIPESECIEERENDDTGTAEGGEDDESKALEIIENEENITQNNSDSEEKANDEPAEKTLVEEDAITNEETGEDSESVKNNDEEEPEAQEAATDETNKNVEMSETKTAADEEMGDEAGKEETDENNAEQSESVKNDDEQSEEKDIITDKIVDEEEISEVTEEPEKSEDHVKVSNETPGDVGDSDAADGTKMTEETQNVIESDDAEKETERASNNSENGEIDAENGEISSTADNKTHEDEAVVPNEDDNDLKTAEHIEDERKIEEPTEDESPEAKTATVESGDDAETHEDNKVDQAPETDMVGSQDKDEEVCVEKQDESPEKDSEQETISTEIKEESKPDNLDTDREDSEETKQDENVSEVIDASSLEQPQSSAAVDVDLDDTVHKLQESSAMSDPKTDNHQHTDENGVGADLSAADGEHFADTEEASKASEEGASVLQKPQEQNEAAEESTVIGEETPEALAREDNTDLVTNWVTMHQTTKFFETFVEPLEELREETSEAQKDENESREETKVEAVESDGENNLSAGDQPHENDPAKETLQEEEGSGVKDSIPKPETEENDKESNGDEVRSEGHKENRGSLQKDNIQGGPTQTQNYVSKTEVESIADSQHSAASGKPECVAENQTEEKTSDNGPDVNAEQTETEEITDLPPSSKTEEDCERSTCPGGQNDTTETQGKTDEYSRAVTEITDFTTSKSEDGSQEESLGGESQPKPSDESIERDRRDTQLIKHTLSKDRLSTFSVDETLFGHSSYTLQSSPMTESGH